MFNSGWWKGLMSPRHSGPSGCGWKDSRQIWRAVSILGKLEMGALPP